MIVLVCEKFRIYRLADNVVHKTSEIRCHYVYVAVRTVSCGSNIVPRVCGSHQTRTVCTNNLDGYIWMEFDTPVGSGVGVTIKIPSLISTALGGISVILSKYNYIFDHINI